MFLFPFLAIFLIQSSLAFLEDSYPESIDSNTYPEDLFDNDNDIELHRRSNHFLRFGRSNGNKYDNSESGYDDYDDFARPTRSGRIEKNDHFIRFGRGKQQEFLRFGRDPQRRAGYEYLRFGRSIPDEDKSKKRSKRDTFSEDTSKRSDAFLRFGRNSNFMRFGRDPSNSVPNALTNVNGNAITVLELLKLQEQTIADLLVQLIANKKEDNKPCIRAA